MSSSRIAGPEGPTYGGLRGAPRRPGLQPRLIAGPEGPAYGRLCGDLRRPGLQPRQVAITAALWLMADAALAACPVCFQVDDTGVKTGVRAAVVVLGGVTAAVIGGVGLFVRRLVKAEML